LCIAAELTGPNEYIKTKTIADWKKEKTDFHKKPVIFLLYAGT
jgi:16S rRNA (cytidine1402-2'-O)-methyltransferase